MMLAHLESVLDYIRLKRSTKCMNDFVFCFLCCSDYLQCFDAVGWATGRASGL